MPNCFGTGLLALDVILNGNINATPKLLTGGSCGNVLSILSFLEWDVYPIARLSKKVSTSYLLNDLKYNKLKTDLITQTDDGSTPIIIHRILKDSNGNPKHRFEFKVPKTSIWLPSYKPVLSNKVEGLTSFSKIPKVFYLDRVSRANIDLAKFYKEKGSVIFFEPSSMSDDKQFLECLAITDIFKFSNDRLPNYKSKYVKRQVFIEIETFGANGLAYRSFKQKSDKWNFLSAPFLHTVQDSAGAGDWCSAGMIHNLCKEGRVSLETLKVKELENSLQYGQFLGAANCCFFGARGLMYNLNFLEVNNLYKNYLKIKEIKLNKTEKGFEIGNKPFDFLQLL